ncbi:hypothetical protein [Actinoplanes sp. NPDC020271]|uniref:hypothetical protein n=1 Tax=Actinoplanes sp. NPDC020271 TaxID=3363896 RepID=UPI0037AD6040
MSVETTSRTREAGGTCLTVNLMTYLSATEADPDGRVARSVRLAVRTDEPGGLLAFSHHRYSLGHLSDGRRLAYRAAQDTATLVRELREQSRRDSGVLIVTYAGAMPWSLADRNDSAPHLVRVTAAADDHWQVDDAFSALLPAGRQEPFRGRITTTELIRSMSAPRELEPEQLLRLTHAFGDTTVVPGEHRFLWVAPEDADRQPQMPEPPSWSTGLPEVLTYLSGFFCALPEHPQRERHIDDLWAAAQHHAVRYTHLLDEHDLGAEDRDRAEQALIAWTNLPMSLHFAADSARRGRPRAALVRTAFAAIADAEDRCAPLLARLGYLPDTQFAPV